MRDQTKGSHKHNVDYMQDPYLILPGTAKGIIKNHTGIVLHCQIGMHN